MGLAGSRLSFCAPYSSRITVFGTRRSSSLPWVISFGAPGNVVRPMPLTWITPERVVPEVERHILLDGFRIVVDLEKSHGCRLVDAVTGRELLDLYGFYGALPVGFNHSWFARPEVQADLLQAAGTKVANSDVLSVPYATFIDRFNRVMGLPPLERYFFIEGGALAVENALKAAMDWKARIDL